MLKAGLTAAVEPLFEAISAHSTDSILLLDRDARILFINRAAPGLTVAQVLGTSVYDYVPEEQHAAMRECFERVLATGEPGRYENVYHLNPEQVMRWESRVGAVRRTPETIDGFVVFASDVTARTQAALERDSIFELSADLMCVVNEAGYFVRVNPAFTHTLGFSEAELLSHPFLDFVHPEDRPATEEAYARSLERAGLAFENRYLRRDGSVRVLQWTGMPDPVSRRTIAVARDVTVQRALEEQLRQSQKMEAVGQLAGGVAHDFNNLVQTILGNVELALARGPDAEMLAYLEDIAAAGHKAAAVTRQLLAFSRRQPLTVMPLDLNRVVDNLVRLLRRVMPENIGIEVILGQGAPEILGDRSQLEQVLMNLCLNARDAMLQGGSLVIETADLHVQPADLRVQPWATVGRYVRLSIRDTGVGMTPEVQARIFEPFFSTKPIGQGTGLGLAVAYGIVQQHGGTVRVDSQEGRGTTFDVYLPVDPRR